MKKVDLIKYVAKESDLTIEKAALAVEAFMDFVGENMSKGEPIILVNFGTFSVKTMKARIGHNPATGKPMNIPEKSVVKFSPSSKLRERK
jgi:hypothetical protein